MRVHDTDVNAQRLARNSTARIRQSLQRHGDDAGRDHRFDQGRTEAQYPECGQRQGNRMGQREDAQDLDEFPQTSHGQKQRRDEQQMVVSCENVPDAVEE